MNLHILYVYLKPAVKVYYQFNIIVLLDHVYIN